jgi:CheY-like chemotaxis protein
MSAAILIVDDEPALNELFVIGLNKYGYDTEGVLSGKDCLDLLKTSYQPDLILLDMMMEPMDGWETLTHIKANKQNRSIPIIMQTGKNLTYKEAEQFSFYIEDYIMKPITPKRCVDFIQQILDNRKELMQFIEKVRNSGCPENQIDRLINLHKAIDVSKRLLNLLSDRYGSATIVETESEKYGPEEFQIFREKIISEYYSLQQKMGI